MARPRKTTGRKLGEVVWFHDGSQDRIALLVGDKNEEGQEELLIVEGSKVRAPLREPKDYGDEGGGRTWHPLG